MAQLAAHGERHCCPTRVDAVLCRVLWRITSRALIHPCTCACSLSIGIMAQNRTEWMITDLVCSVQSYVSVPLYDTLGHDAARYIIQHATVKAVVVSVAQLKDVSAHPSWHGCVANVLMHHLARCRILLCSSMP